ncbi:MAG: anhydro-N-acetylmuramic acid kinase, partial [Gemmatimonadales bacterium]
SAARSAPGMSDALAVGLMSGTSLDGVTAALVRLSADPPAAELVAYRQEPYATAERGAIIDAIARGTAKDLAILHVALGERFAGAVLALLAAARVAPRDVAFIASHGQTVWHEPGRATLQLGDAAVLAERVGIRVVSDFRARDVAAGGQGAPLVPLADVMLFGHPERGRLLLNLGGMANVTWVPRRGVTEGAFAFDTGPGVAVIDAVTRRVDPDAAYDRDGERARRGRPLAKLLEQLLADPFFAMAPPKSTGRERFGIEYADRLLATVRDAGGSDNDAVATATALTAESVARALARWGGDDPAAELVVSGGGARNPALLERLIAGVQPRPVVPFEQLFFDGEAKEAVAFAFLGHRTVLGRAGNLPAATGARGSRILGHVTPA